MTTEEFTSLEEVANFLVGRRLECGISQTDVAVRIGLSHQWVSTVERGKPSPNTLARYAALMGYRLRSTFVLEPIES